MNRDDPLTPEERALAGLLGRRSEQAPPASLDATILAAARAAVQDTAAPAQGAAATPQPADRARRVRKGGRWPAVFGIAASTVLAVGIAWQMRPEPPAPPPMEATAPAQAEHAAADAAAPAAEPAVVDRAAEPATLPPPPPAQAAPAPQMAPAPAAPEPQPAAAPVAKNVVAPPAPPAPPAPVAYAAPAPAAEAAAADSAEMAAEAAPAAAARQQQREAPAAFKASPAPASAPAARAPGVMLRRSSDAGLSAQDVHAEVLADAKLPRRQWLQKIRERRDAGQRDLARISLERYLQQYPESRLPKDLRPLLDD
ncbi:MULTISPECIES: hypothetical protein [Stenotrophomonas]|uniref:hypothetical protein n=1 Tax=Stenotrophomonas TaxID=40323 RepID=UPI000D53F065|nr:MULTISPECIES: hypothetical protein [Stenotrophomonas]AWH32886.1 hypothetical protein C1930_08445 [Stenotrophomonas sp. SAU14A_NAIMI4_8]